jgi:predicted secreted protein
MWNRTLMLVSLALLSPTVVADEPPLTYDRVSLSAGASAEIENDELTAILFAQREGPQVAALANEVNRSVRWGVERTRQISGVKVQTTDYHTNPVYRDGKLTGWRVRQSLRLESRDAPQLSGLIGELQERLRVQSIGYGLSEQRRKTAEDELVVQAISAFQERAKLVTKQLGRPGYRLVSMDVNTNSQLPRPLGISARAMEAAVAPPVLEAGTATVRVTVTGTIELRLE